MSNELKIYEIDYLHDYLIQFSSGKDIKIVKEELNNLTISLLTKAYYTKHKKQTKNQLISELSSMLNVPPVIAGFLIKENESKVKNESTKERIKDLVIVNLENQLQEIEDRINSLEGHDTIGFVDLMKLKNSTLAELAKAVNLNEKNTSTTIVQGNVNNTSNTQNNLNITKLEEKNLVDNLLKSLTNISSKEIKD